jgi:predicted porin
LKVKNTLLAGNYDLGVAKLSLALNRFNLSYVGSSDRASEYAFGVAVPFGPTTVKAQYARSKFKGSNDSDSSLGLEVQYALSKRSTAYVGYNGTSVAGGNVVTGKDAKNSVFATGFRHTF